MPRESAPLRGQATAQGLGVLAGGVVLRWARRLPNQPAVACRPAAWASSPTASRYSWPSVSARASRGARVSAPTVVACSSAVARALVLSSVLIPMPGRQPSELVADVLPPGGPLLRLLRQLDHAAQFSETIEIGPSLTRPAMASFARAVASVRPRSAWSATHRLHELRPRPCEVRSDHVEFVASAATGEAHIDGCRVESV